MSNSASGHDFFILSLTIHPKSPAAESRGHKRDLIYFDIKRAERAMHVDKGGMIADRREASKDRRGGTG